MEFVSKAIKQTKALRRAFKALSIVFGLIALSPIIFSYASSLLPSDFSTYSASYSTNMSFVLTQVLATAFTFVTLDYLLKPRIRDLTEILGFEANREVVSALIGSYSRNLKHNAIFLLVVSAGFLVSALWQLTMAIHWASLQMISAAGGPLTEIYFVLAFQPFLTAVVFILLALLFLGQAKRLKSGLANLESPILT